MNDQKLNVAPKTRRTLASVRSGASPPPRTFKCLKKTPDETDAELKDTVEVEAGGDEVFNEDLDETLPPQV